MPQVSGTQVIYGQRRPNIWVGVLGDVLGQTAQAALKPVMGAVGRGVGDLLGYQDPMAMEAEARGQAAKGATLDAFRQSMVPVVQQVKNGQLTPEQGSTVARQKAEFMNLDPDVYGDINNPFFSLTPEETDMARYQRVRGAQGQVEDDAWQKQFSSQGGQQASPTPSTPQTLPATPDQAAQEDLAPKSPSGAWYDKTQPITEGPPPDVPLTAESQAPVKSPVAPTPRRPSEQDLAFLNLQSQKVLYRMNQFQAMDTLVKQGKIPMEQFVAMGQSTMNGWTNLAHDYMVASGMERNPMINAKTAMAGLMQDPSVRKALLSQGMVTEDQLKESTQAWNTFIGSNPSQAELGVMNTFMSLMAKTINNPEALLKLNLGEREAALREREVYLTDQRARDMFREVQVPMAQANVEHLRTQSESMRFADRVKAVLVGPELAKIRAETNKIVQETVDGAEKVGILRRAEDRKAVTDAFHERIEASKVLTTSLKMELDDRHHILQAAAKEADQASKELKSFEDKNRPALMTMNTLLDKVAADNKVTKDKAAEMVGANPAKYKADTEFLQLYRDHETYKKRAQDQTQMFNVAMQRAQPSAFPPDTLRNVTDKMLEGINSTYDKRIGEVVGDIRSRLVQGIQRSPDPYATLNRLATGDLSDPDLLRYLNPMVKPTIEGGILSIKGDGLTGQDIPRAIYLANAFKDANITKQDFANAWVTVNGQKVSLAKLFPGSKLDSMWEATLTMRKLLMRK